MFLSACALWLLVIQATYMLLSFGEYSAAADKHARQIAYPSTKTASTVIEISSPAAAGVSPCCYTPAHTHRVMEQFNGTQTSFSLLWAKR